MYKESRDTIPLENEFMLSGPNSAGMTTAVFHAFNTVITLQSYDNKELCSSAFVCAQSECRRFERLFSRTLPHSDISRLNSSSGMEIEIHADTYLLLKKAQYYCKESQGAFDITIGSVVRLWDFHDGKLPDSNNLKAALDHVNWENLELRQDRSVSGKQYFARLIDPHAALDVGGIAKGYIADSLARQLVAAGLVSFLINLGGNVVTRGLKPDNSPWRIGIQDPRKKDGILGAIEVCNASAVTSGVYERCFEKDGAFYHHILDPKTGFPAKTDVAGVTVVAEQSIDAEGFSTTLLALGIERGLDFVKNHPEIHAYFVNSEGRVISSQ